MIVIGLDVHKQSVTAVAVDEAGRPLDETTIQVGSDELLGWACRARRGAAVGGRGLPAADPLARAAAARRRRGAGAGAAEADRAGAAGGQDAREVGPDRRARDRTGGAAGAGPAAGRSPASSATARSSCWSIIATISSTSAGERSSGCAGTSSSSTRPTSCRCGCSAAPRTWSASAAGSPATSRSCRCGSRASSSRAAARSTATIAELDQELEQRVSRDRAGAARAARLRRRHRREAARRDRPDQPLQKRRPARPPQRRRPARSKLRPHPTPPTRPRRQPPTQRRALPDRDHPGPLPPRRPRLPRTQTSRRQKPPRSDPLPQTTPRPRRLQHPESEPRLDIGATLAQRRVLGLVALASGHARGQPSGEARADAQAIACRQVDSVGMARGLHVRLGERPAARHRVRRAPRLVPASRRSETPGVERRIGVIGPLRFGRHSRTLA